MFKMTVVEAYVDGKKMDPPDNVDLLSSTVSSLLIEGIAQNTTGSVFEPEVKWFSIRHLFPCSTHLFITESYLYDMVVMNITNIYKFGSIVLRDFFRLFCFCFD